MVAISTTCLHRLLSIDVICYLLDGFISGQFGFISGQFGFIPGNFGFIPRHVVHRPISSNAPFVLEYFFIFWSIITFHRRRVDCYYCEWDYFVLLQGN